MFALIFAASVAAVYAIVEDAVATAVLANVVVSDEIVAVC